MVIVLSLPNFFIRFFQHASGMPYVVAPSTARQVLFPPEGIADCRLFLSLLVKHSYAKRNPYKSVTELPYLNPQPVSLEMVNQLRDELL